MIYSVLAVVVAVAVFFKFEKHRFRAFYAAVVCSIALPIFSLISYAVETILLNDGVDGIVREFIYQITSAFMAPIGQFTGEEANVASIFPGYLMIGGLLATAWRLFRTSKQHR